MVFTNCLPIVHSEGNGWSLGSFPSRAVYDLTTWGPYSQVWWLRSSGHGDPGRLWWGADLRAGWPDTSVTTVCSQVDLLSTTPLCMLSFHYLGPEKSPVGPAQDLSLQGLPLLAFPVSPPIRSNPWALQGSKWEISSQSLSRSKIPVP